MTVIEGVTERLGVIEGVIEIVGLIEGLADTEILGLGVELGVEVQQRTPPLLLLSLLTNSHSSTLC